MARQDEQGPFFVERMVRESSAQQLAAAAAALDDAASRIREGLARLDPGLQLDGYDEVTSTIRVRTAGGRTLTAEVAFDSLGPTRSQRVEAVVGDAASTSRARITIGDSVVGDPGRLASLLAVHVVGAVELVRQDEFLEVPNTLAPAARPSRKQSATDLARLAAIEQASLIDEPDIVVALLAESGLLGDQPRARERAEAVWRRLESMDGSVARRMFDTRAEATEATVVAALQVALALAPGFATDAVVGAAIRDVTDPVVTVRVGDVVSHLPVEVVAPGDRGFAVRLVEGPDGAFRMQVRMDASDPAILVDAAGVLAEFGQRADGAEASAAQDARARVLTALHPVASRAERIMIRHFVDALPGLDDDLRALLMTEPGRVKRLDQPFGVPTDRGRLVLGRWVRRMLKSGGVSTNTGVVGVHFGRDPASILISVTTNTLGDLLQSQVDGGMAKVLPKVPLTLDAPKPADPRPPERHDGMSWGQAVKERIAFGVTGAAAVTGFMWAAGAGLGKILTGSGLMIGASLAQAAVNHAADPFEQSVTSKRGELEAHEPDQKRNDSAEAIYYLVNRIRSEVDTPTGDTRRHLEKALADVEAMIERTAPEVEHRLAEMRRRRNWLQPAWLRLQRITRRPAPRDEAFTYGMAHLPSALPPALTNPGRLFGHLVAGQAPSFYTGSAESPELMKANMVAANGRGPSLGKGWNQAIKQMADDAATTRAARALHHLRQTEQAIKAILDDGQVRQSRPEPSSGRREQHRRDKAAGIPYEMNLATQGRKWAGAFIGSMTATAPYLMWIDGLPGGNGWVWVAGHAFYDAMMGAAEVAGARIELLDTRIDRDRQLTEAADRLPYSMDEIAEAVRNRAEAGRAANEEIVPMRYPAPPSPARRRRDLRRGVVRIAVRGGIGIQRALASDLGLGPSLRPGDNEPDGVRLHRRDALAVNRLVEIARDLDRVVNNPAEVAAGAAGEHRLPVAQPPTMLRGYLRTELGRLGLLADQTGAAARWDAVVADVQRRFGLALDEGQLELAALRARYDEWPDQGQAEAVRDWVDDERRRDPLRHTVADAVDVMARNRWLSLQPLPGDAGMARHIRASPTGLLRVLTQDGEIELDVTVHDGGSPEIMGTLKPAPNGPHRLLVHPTLLGDPEKLATVLRAVVDRWHTDRLGGSATLIVFRPGEAEPEPTDEPTDNPTDNESTIDQSGASRLEIGAGTPMERADSVAPKSGIEAAAQAFPQSTSEALIESTPRSPVAERMGDAGLRVDDLALSDAERNRIFQEQILPTLTGVPRADRPPTAVFIGGQPGAGKKTLQAETADRLGAATIDSDDFLPLHPRYEELALADDRTVGGLIGPLTSPWWSQAAEYVREQRFDVVISSPMAGEVDVERLQEFRDAGYRIEVAYVAADGHTSELSVIDRYQQMRDAVGYGRWVPPATQEASLTGTLDVAEHCERDHLAHRVTVRQRGGEPVYDNVLTTEGTWRDPPGARAAIETERSRPWPASKAADFRGRKARLVDPERKPPLAPDLVDRVHDLERRAEEAHLLPPEPTSAQQAGREPSVPDPGLDRDRQDDRDDRRSGQPSQGASPGAIAAGLAFPVDTRGAVSHQKSGVPPATRPDRPAHEPQRPHRDNAPER
ncbi:zeta toxin family protein [Dactylosporangium sp. NPDC050688]|uniref:zeta toxin family protein n=1 Tax=Dactylosporangium sp. NPDC050688 TaxID=3157217 RepID=UPI0033DB2403